MHMFSSSAGIAFKCHFTKLVCRRGSLLGLNYAHDYAIDYNSPPLTPYWAVYFVLTRKTCLIGDTGQATRDVEFAYQASYRQYWSSPELRL